ncbi:MAG: AEC family transporter [Clostridia bacterium]|nr:AEC family transporter [Clostridia bacterium]
MSNFIFALNATIPVFLVILLGWFLQKVGVINESFCKTANNYVFKCALPISLFNSISTMDLYTDFKLSFALFCAISTVIFFGVAWALTWILMKNKAYVGAFAQGCTRSSAAILGVAFAMSIYGNVGMVPMMIVAAVPLFNIISVLILQFSPHVDENGNLLPKSAESGSAVIKKAVIGVITNPIILGIAAGLPFAFFRITLPEMLTKTLDTVGGSASPIALVVIGASFSGGEAIKRMKPALLASFIKLMVLPAIFVPIAAFMGFTGSEMVAILILVGSPTTVTSYVMIRNMKGDAPLASNIVVISTLLSSVSITFWIYLLKTFALI